MVRREPQGALLRRDHPLADDAAIALSALGDLPVLLHPRAANPGHYDAVLALCRAAGVEPQVLERSPALTSPRPRSSRGERWRSSASPRARCCPPS